MVLVIVAVSSEMTENPPRSSPLVCSKIILPLSIVLLIASSFLLLYRVKVNQNCFEEHSDLKNFSSSDGNRNCIKYMNISQSCADQFMELLTNQTLFNDIKVANHSLLTENLCRSWKSYHDCQKQAMDQFKESHPEKAVCEQAILPSICGNYETQISREN